MKKRSRARELALQGLYSWEVSGNAVDVVLEEVSERGKEDVQIVTFATDLLKKAVEQKETLDGDVASTVENWEFDRIALVDRLILRLALCELLYFDEIPPKVTINEAIDLAKKYSTSQSGRFVNGILDSLYKRFKEEKKIVKRGRGLVE
jgi:N utilization substance protein B